MADTGADAEPRPGGAAGTPGPARRKLLQCPRTSARASLAAACSGGKEVRP